ncbi:MAG: hypothetical protein KBF88_01775 [Polyangiaceae bacterium]|nr:hypothetical protein [Polyangiaceae bacterium]
MSDLAQRVVRRHLDEDQEARSWINADIVHVGETVFSARDLAWLLEDRADPLINISFRRSLTGLPNTVAWEALNDRAELVAGKLILHMALRGETQIIPWVEVTLDE